MKPTKWSGVQYNWIAEYKCTKLKGEFSWATVAECACMHLSVVLVALCPGFLVVFLFQKTDKCTDLLL